MKISRYCTICLLSCLIGGTCFPSNKLVNLQRNKVEGHPFNFYVKSQIEDDFVESQAAFVTAQQMFFLSAPLGMLLDNFHGQFGVLQYFGPTSFQISYGPTVLLKSAIWVPILFGFAGSVMSYLIYILDRIFKSDDKILNPSSVIVLNGILLFSAQYFFSGYLAYNHIPIVPIHLTLASIAFLGFVLFDRSKSGFILGVCTAIAGPLAEVFLINIIHLYQYNDADVAGVCSWIPWVYLLGAPAVGNLSRKIHVSSKSKSIG